MNFTDLLVTYCHW